MPLPIPAPRAEGTTTTTSAPLYWCTYGSTSSSPLLVLHGGPGAHHDYLLPQMLALAEEKGGYAGIRSRLWWIFQSGDPSTQRLVLAHAIRPLGDPSLALRGMKMDDRGVRVAAASAWLGR